MFHNDSRKKQSENHFPFLTRITLVHIDGDSSI